MGFERPDLMARTVVKESPIDNIGLFARTDLTKGTIVARMREPARMHSSDVVAYIDSTLYLPYDSVIYAPRSPLVFYDKSWEGTYGDEIIPWWYRLNHSKTPNTEPKLINPGAKPQKQEMAWFTNKPVSAGSELTFCYESAPEDWN